MVFRTSLLLVVALALVAGIAPQPFETMNAAALAAVALLGPTSFIFDTFTTTLISYLDRLIEMSMRMAPFSASTWVADWTIFYWA